MKRSLFADGVPLALAFTLAFAASGCATHFDGDLRIDGAPFRPTYCLSRRTHNFGAVELGDDAGNRLRVGENVDGTPGTVYFGPGQPIGTNLGPCGAVQVTGGFGRFSGVDNVDGRATFACSAASPRVEGQLAFENCH